MPIMLVTKIANGVILPKSIIKLVFYFIYNLNIDFYAARGHVNHDYRMVFLKFCYVVVRASCGSHQLLCLWSHD